LALKLGENGASDLDKKLDRACASLKQKFADWLASDKAGTPRILTDEAVREPYKDFQESKGPPNQIMIRAVNGNLVDLGERSTIVRAIKPFKLFRLYVQDDDENARGFVGQVIDEEVQHATSD